MGLSFIVKTILSIIQLALVAKVRLLILLNDVKVTEVKLVNLRAILSFESGYAARAVIDAIGYQGRGDNLNCSIETANDDRSCISGKCKFTLLEGFGKIKTD